ncbi:hypothetical protein ACLB2K_016445 [Fragaria x ananassa]
MDFNFTFSKSNLFSSPMDYTSSISSSSSSLFIGTKTSYIEDVTESFIVLLALANSKVLNISDRISGYIPVTPSQINSLQRNLNHDDDGFINDELIVDAEYSDQTEEDDDSDDSDYHEYD